MHDVTINPLGGKVIRFPSRSSGPRPPHVVVQLLTTALANLAPFRAIQAERDLTPTELEAFVPHRRFFVGLLNAAFDLSPALSPSDEAAIHRLAREERELLDATDVARQARRTDSLLASLRGAPPANRVTGSTRSRKAVFA